MKKFLLIGIAFQALASYTNAMNFDQPNNTGSENIPPLPLSSRSFSSSSSISSSISSGIDSLLSSYNTTSEQSVSDPNGLIRKALMFENELCQLRANMNEMEQEQKDFMQRRNLSYIPDQPIPPTPSVLSIINLHANNQILVNALKNQFSTMQNELLQLRERINKIECERDALIQQEKARTTGGLKARTMDIKNKLAEEKKITRQFSQMLAFDMIETREFELENKYRLKIKNNNGRLSKEEDLKIKEAIVNESFSLIKDDLPTSDIIPVLIELTLKHENEHPEGSIVRLYYHKFYEYFTSLSAPYTTRTNYDYSVPPAPSVTPLNSHVNELKKIHTKENEAVQLTANTNKMENNHTATIQSTPPVDKTEEVLRRWIQEQQIELKDNYDSQRRQIIKDNRELSEQEDLKIKEDIVKKEVFIFQDTKPSDEAHLSLLNWISERENEFQENTISRLYYHRLYELFKA